MTNLQTQLTEIFAQYDGRTELFMEIDVHCSLGGLLSIARGAGALPAELAAEEIAFSLEAYCERTNEWGTYYGPMFSQETANGTKDFPSLDQITPDVHGYWCRRAGEVTHPILVFRYAGLVWDFFQKIQGSERRPDLARKMVNAALTIAEWALRARNSDESQSIDRPYYRMDSFQKLERAHEVALALREKQLVETVRNAIVQFEEATQQDSLVGTWGRSFDILVVRNNKMFPIPDDLRDGLVTGMEDRLRRLADEPNPERLDQLGVKNAAVRLAGYYRGRQQLDDVRRVLRIYKDAHVRKAQVANGMLAASMLRDVYEQLSNFGLRTDELEDVGSCYFSRGNGVQRASRGIFTALDRS